MSSVSNALLDRIVLGLWPIAGVTTIGVTADDAEATMQTAIDGGIRSFDTAYSYGYEGESDRLLGRFIGNDRQSFRVLGKVGQRWDGDRCRVVDGSKAQLIADARESLDRLQSDYFDVLFFHQPDPKVAIELSAEAFAEMKSAKLCRSVGICNASVDQIERFNAVVDVDAVQAPLNYIQNEEQTDFVRTNSDRSRLVFVFWTLMKGLLAGTITRSYEFEAGDSRPGYPIFQQPMRSRVHDVLDSLERVAKSEELSLAQLAIGWALAQPGVSGTLVGARRESQVRDLLGTKLPSQRLLNEIRESVCRHMKT
ncbi:MAG: aldo/keto reductase [Planctomycetota bacterium]